MFSSVILIPLRVIKNVWFYKFISSVAFFSLIDFCRMKHNFVVYFLYVWLKSFKFLIDVMMSTLGKFMYYIPINGAGLTYIYEGSERCLPMRLFKVNESYNFNNSSYIKVIFIYKLWLLRLFIVVFNYIVTSSIH